MRRYDSLNATDYMAKRRAASRPMTGANAFERLSKDTTIYVTEYNIACLQVTLGEKGFQGKSVEILYGRETTFLSGHTHQ